MGFAIKIPGDKAPKEQFDKEWDKHKALLEGLLSETIPQLLEESETWLKAAARRKHFVDNVPSQARWFIKFQKGVSDLLKSKWTPLNKATFLAAKNCYQEVAKRDSEIKKKVVVACHLYPRHQPDSGLTVVNFKAFAILYNKLVADFDEFYEPLEKAHRIALEKEKEAYKMLKKYLNDKEAIKKQLASKEITQAEYDKFKKQVEEEAKDLI